MGQVETGHTHRTHTDGQTHTHAGFNSVDSACTYLLYLFSSCLLGLWWSVGCKWTGIISGSVFTLNRNLGQIIQWVFCVLAQGSMHTWGLKQHKNKYILNFIIFYISPWQHIFVWKWSLLPHWWSVYLPSPNGKKYGRKINCFCNNFAIW